MSSNPEFKKSTTMSSAQRYSIIETLISDKLTGNLIEIEENSDPLEQLKIKLPLIIQALQSQTNDKHEFYFLSTGFHMPGKLFRRIEEEGGKISKQNVQLFVLDFVNNEIDRCVKEVTAKDISGTQQKDEITSEKLLEQQTTLKKDWIEFYVAQKKSLLSEQETAFENKEITIEYEMPIIEDLTRIAKSIGLDMKLTEEKEKNTQGEETDKISKYIVITSTSAVDAKTVSTLPLAEIKLYIPSSYFAAQQFYEHTIPRIYFEIIKLMRDLCRDKIFRLTLTKSSPNKPFLIDINLPTIEEKGIKTDIILESPITSQDVLSIMISNRIETIHTEASHEFELGFLKLAKYLSPEFKESTVSPALKKLMLNTNYYQTLKDKKLNLVELNEIDLKTVDFLIKEQATVIKLIDAGIISTKTLATFTPQYFESLNLFSDFTIKHKIKGTILEHLKPKDIEILAKMRTNTSEEDIVTYLLATAALRKKDHQLPDVKLFQEVKDDDTILKLELLQEGLLNLIRKKILTQELIQQLDANQLARVIHGIEKIKDRSAALQYLFITGLLTEDQINKIPKVILEKYENLETIPKELLEFKPYAKDMRTVSFKTVINNFLQLSQDGILDESDLYSIFKNPSLKNLLAVPQLKNLNKANSKLLDMCMESIARQIEFALTFPNNALDKTIVTEPMIEQHFDLIAANCDKWGLKMGPELINTTRFSTQILDALQQFSNLDIEWDVAENENKSNWSDLSEQDMKDASLNQGNEFKPLSSLPTLNFEKLSKFIENFQSINWSKQNEGKLESLKQEIASIFELDTTQTQIKPSMHLLEKWSAIFKKLTNDQFAKNIGPAIDFAKSSDSEAAFAKPLELLNKIITDAKAKLSASTRMSPKS